jgi:hypothetical protein
MYILVNIDDMVKNNDMQVIEVLERDAYDSNIEDAVDLAEINTLGAFYVYDSTTGQEKSDPNYV